MLTPREKSPPKDVAFPVFVCHSVCMVILVYMVFTFSYGQWFLLHTSSDVFNDLISKLWQFLDKLLCMYLVK